MKTYGCSVTFHLDDLGEEDAVGAWGLDSLDEAKRIALLIVPTEAEHSEVRRYVNEDDSLYEHVNGEWVKRP